VGAGVTQTAAVGAADGSSALAGRFIVLKRGSPRDPHYVALAEFDADTGQVTRGCWDLESPPQAIAACWESHARALGGSELTAKWAEAAKGYEMPSSFVRQRGRIRNVGNCLTPFSQKLGFKFIQSEGNGDCFYESVCHALGTIGQRLTIANLRAVVAEQLTLDHLEIAKIEPPEDLKGCLDTLDDYRSRVRESGGAWADDFAMAAVRKHLGLSAILLIDVEARKGNKYTRVYLE
jgi:hypothetical protein